MIQEEVIRLYDEKEAEMSEERMREFEKVVLLRAIDSKWTDHIDAMDQLRHGIHLRAYGQTDPLREYQVKDLQCSRKWSHRFKKILRNM